MSKPKFFEIETSRLKLRRFKDDDVTNFFKYRSNPEVAIYQGWENYTYDQAVNYIEKQKSAEMNIPDAWVQVAIENKMDGQLIGDIGVHTLSNPKNQVEVGFTLEPKYQNKGYAFEALQGMLDYLFNELNKEKINAIAVEQNGSSIKLLKKLGFHEMKKIENSLFKCQYVTELMFGLTKNDWNKR
ncbi:GNAT family N-acetyltransferase [Bacillus sp. AFS055030]|uniref:GNAT family N-acetyltransferase n=1 Tax=Bacillus sp. AFS055030 TaxID=2033507 RepID=UPI000BFDC01D|nr:GNAT family N-acetyltransferase [Bacillus sp. AFS055030]PGL73489.1 ribosomal-protein-serine acetyltransferase [Bacillus sp. AFS055030]